MQYPEACLLTQTSIFFLSCLSNDSCSSDNKRTSLSVCVCTLCVPACVCVCPDCLFVWSDQCVIVCPLSLTVTPEAIGFLSAVGVFVVVLAVLFLFINKKLCVSRVGGLPCLEQHGRKKGSRSRPGIRQGLGEGTAAGGGWGGGGGRGRGGRG